ncbi:vWA domain-containing protein [Paramicrobacterium chengjingii]|uniref:VWA domain-containing protein n=1 Tax=Paramicrobacterium chengjingii TaxID=2769067 RepID=A0ABX6YEV6_9MICO|nr:vWA domain-containing protein [Microbacterium chengjingii]QPZ37205.1 VWA domain-containing protein [Microbacterium chengjingii]
MTFHPVMPAVLMTIVFAALLLFTIVQAVRAPTAKIRLHWISRTVLVVLLGAMMLRPVANDGKPVDAVGSDVDVYFVIDTTSSMAAEDWGDGKPRLDGVRADVTELAETLAGARYSVTTFDAATVERVPLTTDAGAIEQTVAAMTQEITGYSSGSSISAPLSHLKQTLAEANPDHTTILYYIGDGEQTVTEQPESFAAIAEYVDGGAVLGYGTKDGGRMLENRGLETDGEPEYITDPSTGEPALSHIDDDALQTIATQLGVDYLHRDASSSVAEAASGITVVPESEAGQNPAPEPELYWILAIPFGALLLFELASLVVDLRRLRTRGEMHS